MTIVRTNKLGEIIPSKSFKGFIRNGGSVFFTDFNVYADGIIDCWGDVDIKGFKQKIKEGWICLNPKEDDEVRVGDVGDTEFDVVIKSIHVFGNNTEEKILNTINSIIDELNGVDWGGRCVDAFRDWCENKTEHNRKILEGCYLKVPEQKRKFLLGDMDNKDIPIRIAIYGNNEIRNHTHFAVANGLVKSGDVDKLELDCDIKNSIKTKSKIYDDPHLFHQ